MRIEPPPPRVATTRLADPGRGPAVIALLAVAFVAAAAGSSILAGPSGRTTSSNGSTGSAGTDGQRVSPVAVEAPDRSATGQPSPTDEPSLRPGEIACVPAGWRLAYVGTVGSWSVETRLVVAPVPASEPLDVRIPVTSLGHGVISGLGACAPPAGSDRGGRPAVIERAWRVGRAGGSDVALPIELVAIGDAVASDHGARPDALPLLRPAGAAVGWAAGEYVLELVLPEAVGRPEPAGSAGWLRIELESPTP